TRSSSFLSIHMARSPAFALPDTSPLTGLHKRRRFFSPASSPPAAAMTHLEHSQPEFDAQAALDADDTAMSEAGTHTAAQVDAFLSRLRQCQSGADEARLIREFN